MTSFEISVDEGTVILIRQILRRTGRPDISADEVIDEIISAIKELQNIDLQSDE